MEKVIQNLVRYQELCFAHSEREGSSLRSKHEDIDAEIEKVRARLPAEIQPLVDKLRGISPIILAPLINGACSACSQTLPTAMDFAVRRGDKLFQCPGCKRILITEEGKPRQTGKLRGATYGGREKGVAHYSSATLVLPHLTAKSRDEAIAELSARLAEEGFVEDAEALTDMAIRREEVASTAIGKGIAFPHVRGIEGGGLTFALGLKKAGIDFGAPDRAKCRLIFFSLIPTAASAFYLKLISTLTDVFRNTEARKTLLAASTPEEAWETLEELTSQAIK
jgi:mannitol/fructose-specific phosphotransferase system IIA component (Ntr-type)